MKSLVQCFGIGGPYYHLFDQLYDKLLPKYLLEALKDKDLRYRCLQARLTMEIGDKELANALAILKKGRNTLTHTQHPVDQFSLSQALKILELKLPQYGLDLSDLEQIKNYLNLKERVTEKVDVEMASYLSETLKMKLKVKSLPF